MPSFIQGQVLTAAQLNAVVATIPTVGTSGATVPLLNGASTFSGSNTFTPAQIFNNGLNVSSLGTSFLSGLSSNNFNTISVTDSLDASANGNVADCLAVFHGVGGSTAKGARQAFQSTMYLNSPTSSSNTNRFYVAGTFVASSIGTGDGGGSGTEKGTISTINPVATLSATSVYMDEINCGECDISCAAGASVLNKYGWKVVQLATDQVAGSVNDAAFLASNASGAVGWSSIFQIGDVTNQFPLTSGGSILVLKGSPTFASGIDLSNAASITTAAFKSPGFIVDGGGDLTTNGVITCLNNTAIPVGGTIGSGYRLSSVTHFGIFFGSGAPTLVAAQGSIYLRSDGSSTTNRMYINNSSGSGSTWTAVTTQG